MSIRYLLFIAFTIACQPSIIAMDGGYDISVLLAGGYEEDIASRKEEVGSVVTDGKDLYDSADSDSGSDTGSDDSDGEVDVDYELSLDDGELPLEETTNPDTKITYGAKTDSSSSEEDSDGFDIDKLVTKFKTSIKLGEETYVNHCLLENEYILPGHNTLLHYVIQHKRYDLAKELITFIYHTDKEALNSTNAHGDTPLHVAVKSEYLNLYTINMLVEHGANKKVTNKTGQTALDLLKMYHKEPRHTNYVSVRKLLDDNWQLIIKCKTQEKQITEFDTQKKQFIAQGLRLKQEYATCKQECAQLSQTIMDLQYKLQEQPAVPALDHTHKSSEEITVADYAAAVEQEIAEYKQKLEDCHKKLKKLTEQEKKAAQDVINVESDYKSLEEDYNAQDVLLKQAKVIVEQCRAKENFHKKLSLIITGVCSSIALKCMYDYFHKKEDSVAAQQAKEQAA